MKVVKYRQDLRKNTVRQALGHLTQGVLRVAIKLHTCEEFKGICLSFGAYTIIKEEGEIV